MDLNVQIAACSYAALQTSVTRPSGVESAIPRVNEGFDGEVKFNHI